MSSNSKLLAWQETRVGLVIIVLFDLLLTYMFASFAIDTGSLLDYFLAIVFLVLTVAQGVRLFKKVGGRG